MAEIYAGDRGTTVALDLGVDISGSSAQKIWYRDPTGKAGEVTAQLVDGEDTKIEATKGSTLLGVAGIWTLQGYVEYASGNKWYGRRVELRVRAELEE